MRALVVGDAALVAALAAVMAAPGAPRVSLVVETELDAALARGTERDEQYDAVVVAPRERIDDVDHPLMRALQRDLGAAFPDAVVIAIAPEEDCVGSLLARVIVAEIERASALRQAHSVRQVLAALGGAGPREPEEISHDKQREAVLAAILRAEPNFVVQIDASGRIRYANRTTSPNGVTVAIGVPLLDLVLPVNRELVAVTLTSVLASGVSQQLETRSETPSGVPLLLSTWFAPIIVDEMVTGAVLVMRDVTRDKHTEAQLIRADRTSSVGALAAGVAHEINNPLAVVIANLDLAMRRIAQAQGAVPALAIDELRDAAECAETVRQIVGDLEVFARSDDTQLLAVDVHRVIDSVLRMAWSEVRHRARIVRAFGDVPPVLATQHRLGQLLLNLIVNAAQAIEEGHYAGNEIRIATSVDEAGRVVIAIRDTGSGIAPELRPRIFMPFSSTRPHGQAVGLGLTICKRIVASLGGELSFTTEVGAGSEFTVCLPAAPVDEGARSRRRSATPEGPRGRILVVDDDPRVVRMIRRVLADRHEVETDGSGEAALARIDAGERFDVILCDLMMPQMTGMDFMRAVEARAPAQAERVVFVTGGAFTPRARAFLETERYRRLDKPFRPAQLRALVAEVLARR